MSNLNFRYDVNVTLCFLKLGNVVQIIIIEIFNVCHVPIHIFFHIVGIDIIILMVISFIVGQFIKIRQERISKSGTVKNIKGRAINKRSRSIVVDDFFK